MRVISLKSLSEFWRRHRGAEESLRLWYKTVADATWTSIQDVRQAYPHADGVNTSSGETLTVFKIRGNRYRLVTRIRYDYQLINVRAVMTHQKSDEDKWKD